MSEVPVQVESILIKWRSVEVMETRSRAWWAGSKTYGKALMCEHSRALHRLRSPASHSSSSAPSTLRRVRFLAGAAASVDLRFLPEEEVALRGAAEVLVIASLRAAL